MSNGKEGVALRNAKNLVIELEILGPWGNELIAEKEYRGGYVLGIR